MSGRVHSQPSRPESNWALFIASQPTSDCGTACWQPPCRPWAPFIPGPGPELLGCFRRRGAASLCRSVPAGGADSLAPLTPSEASVEASFPGHPSPGAAGPGGRAGGRKRPQHLGSPLPPTPAGGWGGGGGVPSKPQESSTQPALPSSPLRWTPHQGGSAPFPQLPQCPSPGAPALPKGWGGSPPQPQLGVPEG